MKKLLLFDIDGTLLKAGGAGLRGMARACKEVFQIEDLWSGLRVDGRADSSLIREVVRHHLGREITEQEKGVFVKNYMSHLETEVALATAFEVLPGVRELVEHLAGRKDVILGLQTGNYEEAAYIKLRRAGLEGYFAFGGFGSDSEDRPTLVKHAIERGQTLARSGINSKRTFVIGDTEHDITAGKANGVKTLAVFTGWTPRERVEAAGPDHSLESFADLDAFLEIIES